MLKRADGRQWDELRPVKITTNYLNFAEGSVLIEVGKTRVLCAVSIEDRVPPFLKGSGQGWVTAEYSMLPRATLTRTQRDVNQGRISGRSQEIQRLIGRSLRSIVDLKALGEKSIVVDCDVIQADGGTRTAAITGAYVALYTGLRTMVSRNLVTVMPIKNMVAATSVGVFRNQMVLDLCYDEDSGAGVDFNVVMTDRGEYVEIQGTAEGKPFSRDVTGSLLDLAEKGIKQLFVLQQNAIATARKP